MRGPGGEIDESNSDQSRPEGMIPAPQAGCGIVNIWGILGNANLQHPEQPPPARINPIPIAIHTAPWQPVA